MASLASGMALLKEDITVDIVEANEFPDLSQQYGIRGVPTTIIDGVAQVVGAVPAERFLDEVKRYLETKGSEEASPPSP